MAIKKDDRIGAKREHAVKLVEPATRAINKVTGQSPGNPIASAQGLSDETVKALYDTAEEHFEKAEAARDASVSMMEDVRAAIEGSLTRERRHEMAIDK